MGKTQFAHLHVHSHYSLLDGLGKVSDLVTRAKEFDMPALALTDHGVLHGAIEFYQECKKADIKPIIGEEVYIAPRAMTDKSAGVDSKPYHLTLLAKNLIGYRNLIKITTAAHLQGYYYRPRIDQDFLSRHSEGLIALSGCLASQTSRLILEKDKKKLREIIGQYREIFGPDHYYLELQHHPSIGEQQVVNQNLRQLAEEMKLPLVATNDIHYVKPEDAKTHDILVCIQTGKLLSDENRMRYTGNFSMHSPEEMIAAFPDLPEAISNTVKIASMCDLEIPLGQNLLPHFPLPEGETENSYLRKISEEGIRQRYKTITPELQSRLDYELETIEKTGFPGYMLIVADMVKYAKERGIIVGPGRGSAAGSLVAYACGITNADPIKYGLLFERFLDLNRITMPDIDVDYEDTRRGEVIDYLREKYGENHVAGIITFGTIMARAAVRDVGRVMGLPYSYVDKIAKTVPPPVQGRHIPLSKSIKDDPDLSQLYKTDPQAKQLLDAASKLEGTIRHASQHACAIVISKNPLEQDVPVQLAQGGDVHQITQYSMNPIDAIGLLKMDLLGLANLTVIHRTLEIIEAVHHKTIDINKLPLDDKKTFQLFSKGETTGIFQLESSGMKRYIKELKPDRLEDIIAMVALYRPGPLQWIDSFIARKNGREPVKYLHPLAKNALEETYGIPVYQEQVMKMSKDMCGFTGAEADTLRKAIGKKIPKLMAQIKVKFIEGAKKNGVKEAEAEEIFKQLEDFAAYCFNKSHATCYAIIAYQTAYLKAHYPDCFMAALMTSDLNDIDRISIEIAESERLGLTVLPPDVNESFDSFAVVKDRQAIRFGLGAIKNVGSSVAKALVKERKNNGHFSSLEEFLTRTAPLLNKKVLESLVKAGALDRFAPRADLYASLELMTKYAANSQLDSRASNQLTIFGEQTKEKTLGRLDLIKGKTDAATHLAWEKELLGLYLSDHPLKRFQDRLSQSACPIDEITAAMVGQSTRVGGMIRAIKKITTKSNQQMAFVELEDMKQSIELVIFPNLFDQAKELLTPDALVFAEGKISDRDGSLKIIVDRLIPLDTQEALTPLNQLAARYNALNQSSKRGASQQATGENGCFLIELPDRANRKLLEQLKEILQSHPGDTPVEIRVTRESGTQSIRPRLRVAVSQSLRAQVNSLLDLH